MQECLVESVPESSPARQNYGAHCDEGLFRLLVQLKRSDEKQLLAVTYDESEGDEPDLLQSTRERLPSRSRGFPASNNKRHYFNYTMSDSKGGDDATKPAVD